MRYLDFLSLMLPESDFSNLCYATLYGKMTDPADGSVTTKEVRSGSERDGGSMSVFSLIPWCLS